MRNYSPPSYPGSISLFRPEQGVLGMAEESTIAMESTLGWEKENIGQIEVHMIPGYHEYMVYPPGVTVLAQKLQACIEKALIDQSYSE